MAYLNPMYPQPPQQVTPAEIQTNSMIEEAQKQQQNLIDMARAKAIEQDPTLNYVQRDLVKGLLGNRVGWQNALEAGDTDAMAYYENANKMLRGKADAIGLDVSPYGSGTTGVTLEQGLQNLANNDARAISEMFYNRPNNNDYYNQKYDMLRNAGIGDYVAQEKAQQYTGDYQRDNVNRMIDAFNMYGLDDRGTINQNGVRLLGMMAQEAGASPSELANFISNMYAKPVNDWNFQNSLIAAENANKYATDRQILAGQINKEAQERGFAQQEKMARLSNDLGIQRIMAQTQLNLQSGQMSKEMAFNWTVQKLEEAGVDRQTAIQYVTASMMGKGKGTGINSYNDKMVTALQKEAEKALNMANEAKFNGDEAGAKMWMERYNSYQSQIDVALGMGKGTQANPYGFTAEDGDPVNDYNDFIHYFTKAYNENGQTGLMRNEDIFAAAKAMNPQFAESIPEEYRHGVTKAPQAPKEAPRQSKPQEPVNVDPEANSNGYQNNDSAFMRMLKVLFPKAVQGEDGKYKFTSNY